MSKILKNKWFWLALAFVIGGAISFYLGENFGNYSTQVSYLGSFASILGIVIVIVQLAQTKSSVEEAKEQSVKTSKIVSEHLNKVNKAFALADISEIILLPKDIQTNIQNREYGRCYDKMQQLRDDLIEIQQNPEIISNTLFSRDLDTLISEINVRLRAVNLAIQKNQDPYAKNGIIKLMESIRSKLVEFSSKIKYAEAQNGN